MGTAGGTGECSTVSIAKCQSYDFPALHQSVRKCVLPVLSADKKFRKGSKVLLKINLLSVSKGPDKPVNTHPAFVESLARIFREDFSCSVFVGDSSSSFSPGSTARGFKNMGFDRLAEEGFFKIVNFDITKTTVRKNPDNKLIKAIVVSEELKDFDFIVSAAKLKTHEVVGFTGAVKNMLGCIPGKMKRDVHVRAPTSRLMAEALCDIFALAPADFAVMDGIWGMEGNGPSAGTPVNTGVILASSDCVSLDSAAAMIAGFRKGEVKTTVIAEERGLGIADMERIKIVGEKIEDCVYVGFVKPSNHYKILLESIIPRVFLGKLIEKTVSYVPFIDTAKCVRCLECVKGCPAECIDDINGRLVIDKKRCIECFCCQEVCPVNAVAVKPPLTKIMLGKVQNFIEKISG